jgi:hypothetical protein
MYRWMRKGVAGVTLEGLFVGGRWLVSDQAIGKFVASVTQARAGARDWVAMPHRVNDRHGNHQSQGGLKP